MQALDTTIANVALPYMQGSLSASLDQINWVLTSYIVAAAIMTAPIGWVADRFGRKKLFIVCAAGFTVASVLCGLAQNIGEMVAFRLLQGVFGAALVPLSQAVLLDAYPPEERGSAMAIWGIGVMLGPIMGPTLGAWLTDNYSWHWVFFINLPVGIITVHRALALHGRDQARRPSALRLVRLHRARDRHRRAAADARPRRAGRLVRTRSEILIETIVSMAGFYFFFAHSLTTTTPFIRFEMFKDRNFASSCLFMVVIGVVLFGTMALVTPFMQNVIGYPILTAGMLLAGRGIGTLIAMMVVARLMKFIEARWLVLLGLLLAAGTLDQMADFTNYTAARTIVIVSVVQGFGVGPRVRAAEHRRLRHPARLSAHRRLRHSHAGAQYRQRHRHFGGDRAAHQHGERGCTRIWSNMSRRSTTRSQMPDVAGTLNMATDAGRAMMDALVTPAGRHHRLCERLQAPHLPDTGSAALRAGDRLRARSDACEGRAGGCFRLIRPRQVQHVLGEIGQDQVGRDRRHLVEAGLAEFSLDVEFLGKAEAAVGLHAHLGRGL